MLAYASEAKALLNQFEDTIYRQAFIALIDFTVYRKNNTEFYFLLPIPRDLYMIFSIKSAATPGVPKLLIMSKFLR